jgi:hypothetical protein
LHSTTRKLSIDSGGEDGESGTNPGKATKSAMRELPRDFKIRRSSSTNYNLPSTASLPTKLKRVNADAIFTMRLL